MVSLPGMNILRDIVTLSEFKKNASRYIKQVQKTGEPLVLTVNGKPAVVVTDVHSYQDLIDDRERGFSTVKEGDAE